MIADFNTVPLMFSDCNIKYFDKKLPTPKFDIIHSKTILGRFQYRRDKNRIKRQKIMMSDYYDYSEKDFKEILVHEMIHYYIAYNGINDNGDHGKKFFEIADELNKKYDLNITKTKDTSSFKRTEDVSKSKYSFWSIFSW